MLVHRRATTQPGCLCQVALTEAIYSPVWREKQCESKVSCPRTQHKYPGQGSNPDRLIRKFSGLTIKPARLHLHCSQNTQCYKLWHNVIDNVNFEFFGYFNHRRFTNKLVVYFATSSLSWSLHIQRRRISSQCRNLQLGEIVRGLKSLSSVEVTKYLICPRLFSVSQWLK